METAASLNYARIEVPTWGVRGDLVSRRILGIGGFTMWFIGVINLPPQSPRPPCRKECIRCRYCFALQQKEKEREREREIER